MIGKIINWIALALILALVAIAMVASIGRPAPL